MYTCMRVQQCVQYRRRVYDVNCKTEQRSIRLTDLQTRATTATEGSMICTG